MVNFNFVSLEDPEISLAKRFIKKVASIYTIAFVTAAGGLKR